VWHDNNTRLPVFPLDLPWPRKALYRFAEWGTWRAKEYIYSFCPHRAPSVTSTALCLCSAHRNCLAIFSTFSRVFAKICACHHSLSKCLSGSWFGRRMLGSQLHRGLCRCVLNLPKTCERSYVFQSFPVCLFAIPSVNSILPTPNLSKNEGRQERKRPRAGKHLCSSMDVREGVLFASVGCACSSPILWCCCTACFSTSVFCSIAF